jgi:hypothetical protein
VLANVVQCLALQGLGRPTHFILRLLIGTEAAFARCFLRRLAFLCARNDLRLAELGARPWWMPEPPCLRSVADYLAVPALAHHSEVRVGWRWVLRRGHFRLLLVAGRCLAIHRQLIPVAVDP